jgi:hypothetical protein
MVPQLTGFTKEEPIRTLNTMEAEYVEASEIGKSIVWLKQMLGE